MYKKFASILFGIFLFLNICLNAQNDRELIQFSGIVMASDSLNPISYCNISILNTTRGTSSDFYGYFSLVAREGDSIQFSSVGYEKAYFHIPDELETNRYSIIQLMTEDTIYLSETVIYPWPTKDEFEIAFMELNVPDDYLEKARKNLEREKLRELGIAMANDGKESGDYYLRQNAEQYYYAGQIPPMNIFNVFAWGKFIKAWKEGKFKKKKDD